MVILFPNFKNCPYSQGTHSFVILWTLNLLTQLMQFKLSYEYKHVKQFLLHFSQVFAKF